MNFSALFSFPGSLLLLYGIGGALFIVLGFSIRRLFLKRASQSTAFASLRAEAERWHVPQAALPDLVSSSNRFLSACAMGAGIGSLVFALASAILLISPVWNRVCLWSIGTFTNNVWFLFCIIGGSGGGLSVIYRLRREARTMRDGGPRRYLHDYRSPFFLAIPGAWLALFYALVLAFHPSYMPINSCCTNDFHPQPWQGGIVYPWLGFAFPALLSVELLLFGIASARSPLIPTSIPDAAAIDDMFRGRIIPVLQYISIAQLMLFSISFPAVVSSPYSLIGICFPYLCLFAALLLFSSSDLGGKLTGWPWKRKPSA